MTKKRAFTILFIATFVGLSLGISYIGADRIVSLVGSDNALVLMFVLGMIGGFTTFSGVPYHLILMSFTAGGLSPVYLGLVTALGVMLGDSVMYGVSRRAVGLLSDSAQARLLRLSAWLQEHSRLLFPSLTLYGLCSPFSNDFIVASLAAGGVTYRRIIVPLTLGNIGYNIVLGYFGYYAYEVVVSFFRECVFFDCCSVISWSCFPILQMINF